MAQTPKRYQRRNSLRYDGYDYTLPGAYAITICAHYGRCIFGQIIDHEMVLNPLGQIADKCCENIGKRHEHIAVNTYVIMPNHVHVLLTILTHLPQMAHGQMQKERKFGDAIVGSVSSYMGGYKSAVTLRARKRGLIFTLPLWQGKFYDRIVRSDKEFQRHYDYIQANPARWQEDQLHPEASPNQFNTEWRNP